MSKGKIHIVVKYFYPVAAGIETNILETYRVLVSKGWDVTVHTSNLEYTTGEILPGFEIVKGIKVLRYPLSWPCFKPKVPYNEADLVCLHNFDILPHFYLLLTFLFHKLTGKKNYAVVVTPHGGFNPEWRVFSKTEAIIKYIYHYTLGVLLINSVVDAVRAVSEWEKEEMIKKGVLKKKVTVISNGIEDDAFEDIETKASHEIKEKVKSFGDYIIQIGRIYPIKNYETTIKALPKMHNPVKFVIVGPVSDKAYLESLKHLAKTIDVQDRVIFAGVLRGIDKYFLIKHASIMVHMAMWESFCNVVHEGMSQGLPIIAADNTALRYLVKNNTNGYLVSTNDYETVANKVNYILDDVNKDKIQTLSENNLTFAKNNSWAGTASQMDVLYSSFTRIDK